jgi:hypothetical protein
LFKHAVNFFVDSILPEITLTFPENNTRYNITWINITGTANDTNPVSVWINDTANFGQNLGNYQSWNFTNISIAEGSYSLKITANDTRYEPAQTGKLFKTICQTSKWVRKWPLKLMY